MKRFYLGAMLAAIASAATWVAVAAEPSATPVTAKADCGCAVCKCPDCNGEFCTCDKCECTNCGCSK